MHRCFCWGLALMVSAMLVGCGSANREAAMRAEAQKNLADAKQTADELKAEIAKLRAELHSQPAKRSVGYLEELDRLDALKTKGALSEAEFESKKRELLALPPSAASPPSSITPGALQMPELAKQLRVLLELYQNNTINSIEREEKKRQLISKPLILLDLKSDLELVAALYNESVINNIEREELKKKLLQESAGR